jgi:type 1 glutamine amidotransferase
VYALVAWSELEILRKPKMTGWAKWIGAGARSIAAALLLPLLLPFGSMPTAAAAQRRILVYTRSYTPDGKGYVHDNIASSVEAIRKMGAERSFAVDVSDDPATFSEANLKQYAVIVFSNSNNQAFSSDEQRDAFKHYIESGGGFVGIHSASGSERDWPYFWSVLGGKFVAHPRMQSFTVQVADPEFPAVKGLPASFDRTDECYFIDHLNPDIHPVLVTDRTKLTALEGMNIDVDSFPNPLPLAWYHQFDGGREFYLALGHNKQDYANPMLYGVIENGILWAMGQTK